MALGAGEAGKAGGLVVKQEVVVLAHVAGGGCARAVLAAGSAEGASSVGIGPIDWVDILSEDSSDSVVAFVAVVVAAVGVY